MRIVLRCDGGPDLGAGHVARCLPVAAAIARAGHRPVVVGEHVGVALAILEGAGVERRPAVDAPCGIPSDADVALLDVYGLTAAEREAASAVRPMIELRDAEATGPPPAGARVLDYHLDAGGQGGGHASTAGLLGPDYAPLDARMAAARQGSHGGPPLVALGGSTAGAAALEPLIDGLLDAGHERVRVAGALRPARRPGVEHLGPLGGLHDVLGEVSAICCGASVTAYEAASAGTPGLLAVLVDNQARVGHAFAGLTPVLDVRGGVEADAARDAAARVGDSTLPTHGPALVDGHGAARVRDALLAFADGVAPPEPIRQRPATAGDAELLLDWRNDEAVRAVSGSTGRIDPAEHRTWLRRVLADADRTLLICEIAARPVATVRFDRDRATATSEISVTVAPAERASGLGRRVIRESTELELASRPGLRRATARVRGDNGASLRAFEAAGYRPAGTDGAWCLLETVR